MKNIIELAREAGMRLDKHNGGFVNQSEITRFAALVREAERERCAKVCDGYAKNSSNPMNFAENCADAIRSLK